jgi:phosphoribosylanthranilate isomerase
MRTIPVIDESSIDLAREYDGIADYLLLDTFKKEQIGATGQIHNWQISKKIVESVKTPVILAGGLGPDNVEEAIKIVKPTGVDSKTKTDKTNGKGKDLEKVKKFVLKAKSIIKI